VRPVCVQEQDERLPLFEQALLEADEYEDWLDDLEDAWAEEAQRFERLAEQANESVSRARLLGEAA